MKKVPCIKCGQEFDMPDNFNSTILCEICDSAMSPDSSIRLASLYAEEITKLKALNKQMLEALKITAARLEHSPAIIDTIWANDTTTIYELCVLLIEKAIGKHWEQIQTEAGEEHDGV